MRLFIKERTRLDRGFHRGFWNRLQVSADTEPASPCRRLSPLPDHVGAWLWHAFLPQEAASRLSPQLVAKGIGHPK